MSSAAKGTKNSTFILIGLGVLLCIIMFFIPAPANFTSEGWHVLALLIPTIMVWATDAMPVGVASIWFLTLIVMFHIAPAGQAFSGFTQHLPWLMAGAFALSEAMISTNLSRRMSYYLLSRARGYWGMIVASFIANLCMLAVPSSAARCGILAPILNSVMDSADRPFESNFSRYITYAFAVSTNVFIGMLFLTSGASNGTMIGLYAQMANNAPSWSQWFLIMVIPTILLCAILLVGAYFIGGKPEKELVEKLRNSSAMREAYEAMGPMSQAEKKVIVAFILAVLMWAFGEKIEVSAGFSALFVMGLLFMPGIGVLEPKKSLGKLNWSIILLIGAVMGLGNLLNSTGLSETLSNLLFAPVLTPMADSMGFFGVAIAVCVISFIIHFFLPAPNNVSLMVPLLVTWGANYGLTMQAILAFIGFGILFGDKLIFLAYQMPPYYVYLGMEVTNIPKFNSLLMKNYLVGTVAVILASYITYAILLFTGWGA